MAHIVLAIAFAIVAGFCLVMMIRVKDSTPRCSNCKWLKLPSDERACDETYCECKHASNVNFNQIADWFADRAITTYKERPRDLNASNKCENFRHKVTNQFGM